MTILALDIGNTWCKIAIFEDREIVYLLRIPTDDESAIIEWLEATNVNRGIYSTTADLRAELTDELKEKGLIQFSHQMKFPFSIEYKTPETLGRDRLAAVAGASHLYPNQNCLVMDAGTCITYDFLTADGRYLGGNISPGLHMRANAMDVFADKLPLVDVLKWNQQKIGRSTTEALQTGATFGLILEIEGYIQSFAENNKLINNILTGGDAYYLQDKINSKIFARPDLVFRGLIQTYYANAQKIA